MLEIENLSVGEILKNVNLSVADGARHLLRGANGSGKTTLVNAIIGNPEYEIKSGRIIFDGADITEMPTASRMRLGLFAGLQNVPEIPGLSVMSFMKHSFIARNGDVPIGGFVKKLKDAQKRLGIPDDWLGRGMNAGFSGGEKKRLMFLNLLLSEPRLAILDEPDSGTDEAARKTFGEIIAEMRNSSFLIISHQDEFFATTETTTMKKGEIEIK